MIHESESSWKEARQYPGICLGTEENQENLRIVDVPAEVPKKESSVGICGRGIEA
jgi:hypothetical protein